MADVFRGTTSHGFKFEIPVEAFQNYVTLRLLKASDKDSSKLLDVVPRLLGEKQEQKLIEALGGEPSFDEVAGELKEIFDLVKEETNAKKSSPLPN